MDVMSSQMMDTVVESSNELVKYADQILDGGWLHISGGYIGLIIWLWTAISTLLGASTWDVFEWLKGKSTGKINSLNIVIEIGCFSIPS
jgi:hypothetical protein